MKKLLILSLIAFGKNATAQLYLQPGAEIRITGNGFICLNNADLQNNGSINQGAGTGKYVFNGTANNNISGSGTTNFDVLETAKTGSATTSLNQNVTVNGQVLFTGGLIDLNNKVITLDPNAILSGENENSRIIGPLGGYVTITQALNAPAAANPGNLGAALTTAVNLGSTTIKRSHQPVSGSGSNSIKRVFDINPTTNTNLGAKLRLYYFDAELNGANEANLVLWKKQPATPWVNMGVSAADASLNWAEKLNLTDFSSWTLAATTAALPISLVSFEAIPSACTVLVKWRTEIESNAGTFELERSQDGNTFIKIYSTAAQGRGSDYSFKDMDPGDGLHLYRLKMIDKDGTFTYSALKSVRSTCQSRLITVSPNPAGTTANVNGLIPGEKMSIYNAAGQLVWQQIAPSNTVPINISAWPKGVYQISVLDKQDRLLQVLKLIHL